MTAKVITVTSGKGGVGKTTASANIAIALASFGNKVCCIDADIGLRNLDIVLGLENRIVYDLVDVVEGRAKLRQAMIKDKRVEELYLIPAAQTRDKTAVSPSDMVRICDELRTIVDFVVVDSPAGIERGFRNAVAPADMVIIVTNPEVSSVRDADRIIGLIEAEGKGPGHLVINRVKPEMVKRGDMLSPEDVIDILAIKMIGLVPEDEAILVSTNRGLPASMTDDSRAGRAFRNIARRIMGEEVPFLSMEEDKSWSKRLLKAIGLGGEKDKEILPEKRTPKPAVSERPAPAPAPAAQAAPIPSMPAPVVPTPAPVTPSAPAPVPAASVAPASVASAPAVPVVPSPPVIQTPVVAAPTPDAAVAPATPPSTSAVSAAAPISAPKTVEAATPINEPPAAAPAAESAKPAETDAKTAAKKKAKADAKEPEAAKADEKSESKPEAKENGRSAVADDAAAKPVASSANTSPSS